MIIRLSFIPLVVLFMSANAYPGELLPFPEQNRPPAPLVDQKALQEFSEKLSGLSCDSLREVRDGLATRLNNSTTQFDRTYYQSRLDVVRTVMDKRDCP